RGTSVIRRQWPRSLSPSYTPTVVSVLPTSQTRITCRLHQSNGSRASLLCSLACFYNDGAVGRDAGHGTAKRRLDHQAAQRVACCESLQLALGKMACRVHRGTKAGDDRGEHIDSGGSRGKAGGPRLALRA